MSGRNVSLVDETSSPTPHTYASEKTVNPQTHGLAGPDSPWCRCGRLREACVSDEVRSLWPRLLDPAGR